jgi:hypothetical protein
VARSVDELIGSNDRLALGWRRELRRSPWRTTALHRGYLGAQLMALALQRENLSMQRHELALIPCHRIGDLRVSLG